MVTLLFMHIKLMWLLNATQHKKVVTNVFLLKLMQLLNANMPGKKVSNIFKFSLGPLYPIGVHAKVELKSSIPIGSITEISPKGFTIGVKAENEKLFFFNLSLYGPDFVPKAEKGYLSTWKANLQPLSQCWW